MILQLVILLSLEMTEVKSLLTQFSWLDKSPERWHLWAFNMSIKKVNCIFFTGGEIMTYLE